MKLLEEVAKQFGVSEPIFKATLMYDDTRIEFQLKDPYLPNKHGIDDPVARIVAKRFQETLKPAERRFVQCTHFRSVYSDIMGGILLFVEQRSPLKNPTQSKLYKWLRSVENEYNHPASEGFIGLYRYMCRPMNQADDVKNVLAILEMIREKYEDAN